MSRFARPRLGLRHQARHVGEILHLGMIERGRASEPAPTRLGIGVSAVDLANRHCLGRGIPSKTT